MKDPLKLDWEKMDGLIPAVVQDVASGEVRGKTSWRPESPGRDRLARCAAIHWRLSVLVDGRWELLAKRDAWR